MCYSAIFAPRTFAWFFECFAVLKLKPAIHTIIGLETDLFFLMPDGFFYECQMMVNILFRNTNQLGNIPHRQVTVFEMTYDCLPDSLFSFMAHIE
ncbi:MAG: hypothetical protein JEZ12_08930 [Desulfobacterium sp.]|nr:hypothetical protein [Desulfobacterium sp.]